MQAIRERRHALLPPMFIVFFCALGTLGWAEEEISANFTTGKSSGSLNVTFDKAKFEKEGEQHHLAIAAGGKVTGSFDLTNRRGEVVVEIVARTSPPRPIVYGLTVNDQPVHDQVEFSFDTYTSWGHDISRYLVDGRNTVTFSLLPTSQANLWVREMRIRTGKPLPTWEPWAKFVVLGLASYALCRLGVFRLLWWRGRGIDPVWATWLSLFLMVDLWYQSYRFAFAQSIHVPVLVIGLLVVLFTWVTLRLSRT